MKFKKGNKRAEGGKRKGAGRPTKQQQEVKKAVAEKVQAYIEEHVESVLKSDLKLTQGREINHYDQKGTLAYKEEIIDSATVRHWIDKFVPAAKQEIQVTGDFKFKIRQEVINKILGRETNEV